MRRRTSKKAMFAATILSVFTIGGCAGFFGTLPNPSVAAAPTVGSAVKSSTYQSAMVNCEDFDIQPCYTYDEGSWRIVLSYNPYKAVKAYDCTAEDGGKKLPCVWKQDNKKPKGHKSDPSTRNVFWKGKLG